MESKTINTAEAEWQELTAFPGEGRLQVLREEDANRAKTLLIRLRAGGRIVPHAHVAAVQHYVLEGQYESEGNTYEAGTYRLMPGHGGVAPISTRDGVTILLIYDAAA